MSKFSVFSRYLCGLAFVTASACGHALSLASVLHLHTHLAAAKSEKAELKLSNPNFNFRDVRVGDRVYTVHPHHNLMITAPVGTPVFAASGMFHRHAKGDVIAQVESGRRTVALD